MKAKSFYSDHTFDHCSLSDETVESIGGQLSNLTVTGLTSDTNYSCTAYNDAGTSEKSLSQVTVRKRGRTKRKYIWA